MRVQPARRVCGSLRLPGDKSISHRAAIIAALACGASRIRNYATGEDCAATLACLEQLGVTVERTGTEVIVRGAGLEGLRASRVALDCGNSGSTMRMLAGVLAGCDFASTMTGDESLRARPMLRIIEPLELMGARIEATDARAPLCITGRRPLKPLSYSTPHASAQVKSCILLAGLGAAGRTAVTEISQTRDHTERLLEWFGVRIETAPATHAGAHARTIVVSGAADLLARDVEVPGDISSAAFFIAAAALLPGSELLMEEVCLNPTRTGMLQTMKQLGADIRISNERERCLEPVGDVLVHGGGEGFPLDAGPRGAHLLRGADIAGLIDELPVLAVIGTQTAGGLEIRDAAELRVKETDRIMATAENLRAMGAEVVEHADGLTVKGRTPLRGARLNSYGDHRIAMAFTVAALLAEGESEIEGAQCVRISFPEFYALLDSVVER